MIDELKTWQRRQDTHFLLAGFGSSNTDLSWHSQGRLTWFCWLSSCIRYHVGKHVEAVNCGICGDTTEELLTRFGRDITPLRPSMTIVTIGGNDFARLSLDAYRSNLARIVEQLRALGSRVVLQTYYSPMLAAQDLARFDTYMEAVRATARESSSMCIDHYPEMKALWLRDPDGYRAVMQDEMHLNPIGNAAFGALCCRSFGLPDPEWPAESADAITAAISRISTAV